MTISHANHAPLKCRKPVNGSILILELGGTNVRSPVETVNVAVVVALGVTMAGETEQVAFVGAPLQLSATCWANPPIEEIVSA